MSKFTKFCQWCGAKSDHVKFIYNKLQIADNGNILIAARCTKCNSEFSVIYKPIISKISKDGLLFKNNKDKQSQAN